MTEGERAAAEDAPVRPPAPRAPRQAWTGWGLALCILTFSYPGLLVASLYGTWLVAWSVLGHRPVPSIDDPKSISPLVSVPYVASFVVFLGALPACLLGLLLVPIFGVAQRLRWTVLCTMELGLAALWFATFALVRWDPLRVMYWFMD